MPGKPPKFSWLRPSVLWASRNDVIAKWFGDPSDDVRRRWLEAVREGGADPQRVIGRSEPEPSFLLVGDTGEGDKSQYAVVPGLLNMGADTDFMIIGSDVIYPAGSANDYRDKFFNAYQGYPAPIYAIPGNHDWYDGLGGFMRVFCGMTEQPEPGPWRGPLGRVAALLWRRPERPDLAALDEARKLRGEPGQRADQPGPYWAIDFPALRIIGIDTGIVGGIDREQAEWLRRVSAGPTPKILITGKPIYVDGRHNPGRIEGGGTVDEIVRDPANHYVAAIGGDIHNYQRFPVRVGDRVIQYLVSGAGGAYMHATHIIPRQSIVDEESFKCYPLRGDSLSFYSRLYGRRLRLRRLFELSPEEAAAAIARRLDLAPTRQDREVVRPSLRARMVAFLLGVPRGRRGRPLRFPVRKVFQRFRSEAADWDTPPFFKSFLRFDVAGDELRIRCFAATGCREHELEPPLEDEVVIPLASKVTQM